MEKIFGFIALSSLLDNS